MLQYNSDKEPPSCSKYCTDAAPSYYPTFLTLLCVFLYYERQSNLTIGLLLLLLVITAFAHVHLCIDGWLRLAQACRISLGCCLAFAPPAHILPQHATFCKPSDSSLLRYASNGLPRCRSSIVISHKRNQLCMSRILEPFTAADAVTALLYFQT